jgi:hypothetical protein
LFTGGLIREVVIILITYPIKRLRCSNRPNADFSVAVSTAQSTFNRALKSADKQWRIVLDSLADQQISFNDIPKCPWWRRRRSNPRKSELARVDKKAKDRLINEHRRDDS